MNATFYLRSCCHARPNRLAADPGVGEYFSSGEKLREATPQECRPDRETAWHEAGHCVVGVAFGMTPVEISAATFGFVAWACGAPDADTNIMMTMAGDHAANLRERIEDRPFDADLKPWISFIREPAGGGCDMCLILRSLVARHGISAPDAIVLNDFRRLETRTLEILRDRRVRTAIRAVADALMVSGHLSGRAALDIVIQYLEPGEFLTPNGEHNEIS